MSTQDRPGAAPGRSVQAAMDPFNVWRAGLSLLAVVALGAFGWFVLTDGGSVIFTVVMAWFASLAMEPAVRRLSTRMRRGAATAVVMAATAAFLVGFLGAFGSLFVDQIATLLRTLPSVITSALDWVNGRFGSDYKVDDVLSAIKLTPAQASQYANQVVGGLLGAIGSVVATVFSLFTFSLLTFYLSADGPRLRHWIAGLLPGRSQQLFVDAWDLTAIKTGGYVAARVVLAAINGGTTAIVFLLIGMPSWLALGVWTGLVAQFVPTIGTYISIVLPVLVGLLSPSPWIGVAALVWAIVYQQVENLTIEPRISARAVNIHPGVSFCAVLLGSALFGAAGALIAVPVCAMLLSLLDLYGTRREVTAEPTPGLDPEEPADLTT